MSLRGDTWIPGLVQTGPPPGAKDEVFNARTKRDLWAPTLAVLRSFDTHPDNLFCDLLGYESLFDGRLQGRYMAITPNRALYPPDGPNEGSQYVYSNDGETLWIKFQ